MSHAVARAAARVLHRTATTMSARSIGAARTWALPAVAMRAVRAATTDSRSGVLDDILRPEASRAWRRAPRELLHQWTFKPTTDLAVRYTSDEAAAEVYRGTTLTPTQAGAAPEVLYQSRAGRMWTLLMVSPGAHVAVPGSERRTYAPREFHHWMVANIPGHRVAEGDVVKAYVPPHPSKDAPEQRYVFVLLEQLGGAVEIDAADRLEGASFAGRRQHTVQQLMRKYRLRPAGLSFFKASWDEAADETMRAGGMTPPLGHVHSERAPRRRWAKQHYTV